jgi:hypothetical protein
VTGAALAIFVMKSKAPRLDCEPSDLVTALGTISGKWKLRIIYLLLMARNDSANCVACCRESTAAPSPTNCGVWKQIGLSNALSIPPYRLP